MSQNESGWSVVVGEKPEDDSRDEVRAKLKRLRKRRKGIQRVQQHSSLADVFTDRISEGGNALASVRPSVRSFPRGTD